MAVKNTPPNFITIHAAATYPSMTHVDADWIRDIHVGKNKWKDIGYHFVITRDGTLQTGRDLNVVGAHVARHNTKNIGICMAGGLKEGTKEPEDNFTEAQYNTLDTLVLSLLEDYPEAQIMGHNGFAGHEARGCPCFDWETYAAYIKDKFESVSDDIALTGSSDVAEKSVNEWMDEALKDPRGDAYYLGIDTSVVNAKKGNFITRFFGKLFGRG